jgi:hypothetical protein
LEVIDDWPPVDVEGMWATSVGEDRYKIDNIPFHALGVSDQDVIAAGPGEEPGIWFREIIEPSEFSTVRIAVADEEDKQPARDLFKAIGCDSEGLETSMFALSIPRASLDKAMTEIRAGETAGRWDWEEGVIRA